MRKNRIAGSCIYGEFNDSYKPPDRGGFELRFEALRLNQDLRAFCKTNPGLDEVTKTWDHFNKFMQTATDVERCFFIYGNILEDIDRAYERFQFNVFMYHITMQQFPLKFIKLDPGQTAPAKALSLSFDPALSVKNLRRLFDGFLKRERKAVQDTDNINGYFVDRPSRGANRDLIPLYLSIYDLKIKHPEKWRSKKEAKALCSGLPPSSLERTLRRYAEKGRNLSAWAIRGVFPKTTTPHK